MLKETWLIMITLSARSNSPLSGAELPENTNHQRSSIHKHNEIRENTDDYRQDHRTHGYDSNRQDFLIAGNIMPPNFKDISNNFKEIKEMILREKIRSKDSSIPLYGRPRKECIRVTLYTQITNMETGPTRPLNGDVAGKAANERNNNATANGPYYS